MAAEFVTPEAINFMVTHGRGLVCLTLTEERCRQLDLPLMAARNGTRYGTNFTQSIEAAEGVETGISAADRARTIQVAVARDAAVRPGAARPHLPGARGARRRVVRAHTEAGCDLTAMAGLTPAAVICEILKPDGTMARLPDLVQFARQHQLKIGTIADLIQYRSEHESIVKRLGRRRMQTAWGEFDAVAYQDAATGSATWPWCTARSTPTLKPWCARAGLGAGRAGHRRQPAQLERAQRAGGDHRLAGRRAGADELPVLGRAPVRPDRRLGRRQAPAEPASADRHGLRTYGIGAQILRDLNVGQMKCWPPRKMPSMAGFSLTITGYDCDPPESSRTHRRPT